MGSVVTMVDGEFEFRCLDSASARGVYSVHALVHPLQGVPYLQRVFDKGRCTEFNLVLFATSGIHGSYCDLNDAERWLRAHPGASHETWDAGPDEDSWPELTFVVLQPRKVAVFYGNLVVRDLDDVLWLRRLADSVCLAVRTVLAGCLPPAASAVRSDSGRLRGWTQGDVLDWATNVTLTSALRGEEPTADRVALALSVLDVVEAGAVVSEEFRAVGCAGILRRGRDLLAAFEAAQAAAKGGQG